MVATNMDLAEAVLNDAGRPQEHLIERGIVAERIFWSAEAAKS